MKPQSFTVFDVELRRNEAFSVLDKADGWQLTAVGF
jgi:hypothetical protein